jgi:hypothetical protein
MINFLMFLNGKIKFFFIFLDIIWYYMYTVRYSINCFSYLRYLSKKDQDPEITGSGSRGPKTYGSGPLS